MTPQVLGFCSVSESRGFDDLQGFSLTAAQQYGSKYKPTSGENITLNTSKRNGFRMVFHVMNGLFSLFLAMYDNM